MILQVLAIRALSSCLPGLGVEDLDFESLRRKPSYFPTQYRSSFCSGTEVRYET